MAAAHHGTQLHCEAGVPQARTGSTCSDNQLARPKHAQAVHTLSDNQLTTPGKHRQYML